LNLQINYVSESRVSIKGVSEMKYGYARVSSKGQDYTAQVEALKAAGCERIFSENWMASPAALYRLGKAGAIPRPTPAG
jgi:hypothetical protein